jgi:hypothetical protein
MIAVSIPLFPVAPLVRGLWEIPLWLFTAGALGKSNPPEFLKDWRFCWSDFIGG